MDQTRLQPNRHQYLISNAFLVLCASNSTQVCVWEGNPIICGTSGEVEVRSGHITTIAQEPNLLENQTHRLSHSAAKSPSGARNRKEPPAIHPNGRGWTDRHSSGRGEMIGTKHQASILAGLRGREEGGTPSGHASSCACMCDMRVRGACGNGRRGRREVRGEWEQHGPNPQGLQHRSSLVVKRRRHRERMALG